ncbi:MAG: VWA domain-containing protein [Chloroflexi bacterium]|nr:VWA domain-containing protein [Chloroflexota bacterium]
MKRSTFLVLVVVVLAVVAAIVLWRRGAGEEVSVVHWSNGHLVRPGLLKEMSAEFNKAGHRTRSGKRIKVEVFSRDSVLQVDDLLSRISRGVPLEREIPDPTIVTPQSAEWLNRVTQGLGRPAVDTGKSRSIARSQVGIVTYREMAEALGWPNKDIGYADLVALRNDPKGWASYPGARAEWGQKPLLSFTDPTTSSTGRSALFSLYAIAAGKPVDQLTPADITDPNVVNYVKQFQKLIDHYMTGTIPQNTKVYQGPRYGHFFLMPEDNLIHLYEGSERAFIDGVNVQAPPISRPMVMVYPKEGSMAFSNIAGVVNAAWVTEEQKEAADQWIDFLLQDEQQRAFMRAGFRPGSNLPLNDPSSKISGRYGLEPAPRAPVINPERIDPAVAAAIEQSWQEVKRPGIVTLVVDVSGSMTGTKLYQAKQGLVRALDGMAQNNQVGLLTFSSGIRDRVPVAPLSQNRYELSGAIENMKANGGTALYDAIKGGIEMTDSVAGADNAIRAVVVLTDGQANEGKTHLDDIIQMMSRQEVAVRSFTGFENDVSAVDKEGRRVAKQEVIGSGPALKTSHPVQIFFIGIGQDADMDIGRMLAQATGAEFQGVADKDLAKVLAEFSKYF